MQLHVLTLRRNTQWPLTSNAQAGCSLITVQDTGPRDVASERRQRVRAGPAPEPPERADQCHGGAARLGLASRVASGYRLRGG